MADSLLPSKEDLYEELDLGHLSIRSIRPFHKRTHYKAVLNWLHHYQGSPQANDLNQVRGLLESFQHLCAVEDWRRASQILTLELNTELREEFHNKLYTWGYCQEQANLYGQLLGKLDSACDSIFLNGLGLAYRSLGRYEDAREAYEQSLALAHQVRDLEGIQATLCNLGAIHCLSGSYSEAMSYTHQALQLAEHRNDISAQGTVLGSLGLIYQAMEEFQNAAKCHECYLLIARRIGDRISEMHALSGLGIAHHQLNLLPEAINYHKQSLEIALDLGDRFSEATTLGNLAAAYQTLADPQTANEYAQRHLAIAQDIGDRAGEARARAILNDSASQIR